MTPRQGYGWPAALAWFALALTAIAVAYWPTIASFPRVWSGSDTFTHCFFVIPICAWLVWRRRDQWGAIEPHPEPLALILLAGCGLLWVVADAADVLVYAQFSLAAMVPLLAVALFGRRVARILTFPYAFFLLTVPFGEVLQPALMQYTAKFTVAGLRLTGVPVWVEGLYFATPTGHWRVIEACSGLRFLISMSTLGALFAYLQFERVSTRLLFGALAVLMPLVANGLRAYTMVLTGYLSDMKIGLGLDHFIMGWALFTVVMAIFFFVGSRWRETPLPPRAEDAVPSAEPVSSAASGRRASLRVVGTAALLIVLWPIALAAWSRTGTIHSVPTLEAAAPASGWRAVESVSSWKPSFHGTTVDARRTYLSGDEVLEYYVGYYAEQNQGAELINFENVVVPRADPIWRNVGERTRSVATPSGTLEVRETHVRSETERYLVWTWFWLPDVFTASQVMAKLDQARARLLHRKDHAAVVILSAPYLEDEAPARVRLERFVRDTLPAIHTTLRDADRSR